MEYNEFGLALTAITIFVSIILTSDLIRFTYIYYKSGFDLMESFRKAVEDLFGGMH